MFRAILILITLLPAFGQAALTIHDAEYLEAACEGRWPGRFIEISPTDTYDCETGKLIPNSELHSCEDTSEEECYDDI